MGPRRWAFFSRLNQASAAGGWSDRSPLAVPADLDAAALDDHGHGAIAFGVAEHPLQARSIAGHVDVLKGNLAFAVVLTGGTGVGSAILAEDDDLLRHVGSLVKTEV